MFLHVRKLWAVVFKALGPSFRWEDGLFSPSEGGTRLLYRPTDFSRDAWPYTSDVGEFVASGGHHGRHAAEARKQAAGALRAHTWQALQHVVLQRRFAGRPPAASGKRAFGTAPMLARGVEDQAGALFGRAAAQQRDTDQQGDVHQSALDGNGAISQPSTYDIIVS
jgi:hypothetical protein